MVLCRNCWDLLLNIAYASSTCTLTTPRCMLFQIVTPLRSVGDFLPRTLAPCGAHGVQANVKNGRSSNHEVVYRLRPFSSQVLAAGPFRHLARSGVLSPHENPSDTLSHAQEAGSSNSIHTGPYFYHHKNAFTQKTCT